MRKIFFFFALVSGFLFSCTDNSKEYLNIDWVCGNYNATCHRTYIDTTGGEENYVDTIYTQNLNVSANDYSEGAVRLKSTNIVTLFPVDMIFYLQSFSTANNMQFGDGTHYSIDGLRFSNDSIFRYWQQQGSPGNTASWNGIKNP